MKIVLTALFWYGAAMLGAACGTTAPSAGSATCSAGAQQSCLCTDGTAGQQACRVDGSYSACSKPGDGGAMACAADVTRADGGGVRPDGGAATACVPNATRACTCSGISDQGVQTCGGENSWGECRRAGAICAWPAGEAAGWGAIEATVQGDLQGVKQCNQLGNTARLVSVRLERGSAIVDARFQCAPGPFSLRAPIGQWDAYASATSIDGDQCWHRAPVPERIDVSPDAVSRPQIFLNVGGGNSCQFF